MNLFLCFFVCLLMCSLCKIPFKWTTIDCKDMLNNGPNFNGFGRRNCMAKNMYLFNNEFYAVTTQNFDPNLITTNLYALNQAPGGKFNSWHIASTVFTPKIVYFNGSNNPEQKAEEWLKAK